MVSAGQPSDIVTSGCPGSSPGFSPVGKTPGTPLKRGARGHPIQIDDSYNRCPSHLDSSTLSFSQEFLTLSPKEYPTNHPISCSFSHKFLAISEMRNLDCPIN